MKAISGFATSSILVAVVTACSGSATSTGTGSSGSSGSSTDGTVPKGGETVPDGTGTPSTPAPTGKSCGTADECAYYFCRCADGAIVNSRLCSQHVCQGAAAHCGTACTTFRHGAWTGTYGGGDTPAPPTTRNDGGTTTNPPAGSCTSKDQCAPFQCGCTNGSRITVRDCFNNRCQDAELGCQSACSDSGRGDWDGT